MILQRDPKMRPSLEQIESHTFFTQYSKIPDQISIDALNEVPSDEYIGMFKGRQSKPLRLNTKEDLNYLEENLELKKIEFEIL